MKILLFFIFLALLNSQLTIVCDDVLQFTLNTQFSYPILITGGQGPFSYFADGLPNGIIINSGSITGLSTNQGIYPVILTVWDDKKNTSNKHIFVYVTSPTKTDSKIQNISNAYKQPIQSQQIQASLTISLPTMSASSSKNLQTSTSSTIDENNLQRNNNTLSRTLKTDQSKLSSSLNINTSAFLESFPINFPFISTANSFQNIQSNFNLQSIKSNNLNPSTKFTIQPRSLNAGSVFQEQSNINKLISNTLLQIQNNNNTLNLISKDIINTTFLLNKANQNQKSAHTELQNVINQNNSLNKNMSNLQQNIRTLQNQILLNTKTINNSQALIENSQNKIIQYYIKINDTQSHLIQTNNSLQASKNKQQNAAFAVTKSRKIIEKLTQNITCIQNDINNAPSQLLRLSIQINNQKAKILELQRQLKQAILGLVPIQQQVEYYNMIPILGPGQIQQNKTLLVAQSFTLAQVQPVYEKQKRNVQFYTNQIKDLTFKMKELKSQLSTQQVLYNNIMGQQSKQQNNFYKTLLSISQQTQSLNKMREEQNRLTTVYSNLILNIISDSSLKVKQLNRILDSLNRKYISVQSEILQAQNKLKEYIYKKESIDNSVDKVIKNERGDLIGSSILPKVFNGLQTISPIKGL